MAKSLADLMKEKETLLAAQIESQFSSVDAGIGSAVRELVIRPAALMAAQSELSITESLSKRDIRNATSLSDVDVEAIASNYFITRKQGSYAYGQLAVVSSASSLSIPITTKFTIAGEVFSARRAVTALTTATTNEEAGNMLTVPMTALGASFICIVPVVSDNYTSVSIAAGVECTATPSLPRVLSITTASPITGGSTAESNEELLARCRNGVTSKVLSGKSHIAATLLSQEDIPVYGVSVFGMGDPEMTRDKDPFLGLSCGGCADVYAKTAFYPEEKIISFTWTKIDADTWTCDIPSATSVVIDIQDVTVNGEIVAPDKIVQEDFISSGSAKRFYSAASSLLSSYHIARLSVSHTDAGSPANSSAAGTAKVHVLPYIDSIQAFVDSEDRAPSGQEIVAKASFPVKLHVSLRCRNLSDSSGIAVRNSIQTAINAFSVGKKTVTAQDILSAVTSAEPHAIVDFPLSLEYSASLFGTKYGQRSVVGRLELPETVTDSGITYRNCFWYSDTDSIQVEVV